jgi:hypothetical protein
MGRESHPDLPWEDHLSTVNLGGDTEHERERGNGATGRGEATAELLTDRLLRRTSDGAGSLWTRV